MFGAATWAAARPTGAGEDFDATHPEDIMLCVGQPVTDAATAEFLDYFARQAADSDQTTAANQTQRIGLTSVNRRVVPLTRDHSTPRRGSVSTRTRVRRSRRPSHRRCYTRTTQLSVNDVLALCISGFPSFEAHSHAPTLGDLPRTVGSAHVGRATCRTVHRRRCARPGRTRSVSSSMWSTRPRSPASGSLLALTELTGGRYLVPGSETRGHQ